MLVRFPFIFTRVFLLPLLRMCVCWLAIGFLEHDLFPQFFQDLTLLLSVSGGDENSESNGFSIPFL